MQLQIECNQVSSQQPCLICNQLFETTEAKILVCNDQGKHYGELCSECLEKGFDWLSDRFQQLNRSRRKVALRQARSLETSVSA